MSEGYVQVPPDASGKKVATVEIVRPSDANTVEIQLVALANPTTGEVLVTADGRLDVDTGTNYPQISFTTTGDMFEVTKESDFIFKTNSPWNF